MLVVRKHRKETMLMKLLLVSVVAACALMMALAGSAFATGTDSHFPEGVSTPGTQNACNVLLGTPAVVTGSDTGFANKSALYVDACLGGT